MAIGSAGHLSVVGNLRGGKELRARIKAVSVVFKPYAKKWAKEAVTVGKPRVPVRTGRLQNSIRVKSVTQYKATVAGHYTAYFIDAGARYASKSRKGRNTIFHAKSGFRMQPRPFRAYMAHEALRRVGPRDEVIRAWNDAA
jgi:regulation of enolase protein 1 (concanavalin A-like superfamily)